MSTNDIKRIRDALNRAERAVNKGNKDAAQDALSDAFELGKTNKMDGDQQRKFQRLWNQAR